MAILIPASFGRLTITSRAQVRVRVSASANQRTIRRDSALFFFFFSVRALDSLEIDPMIIYAARNLI
jgi:hypothetical protein